jgi:hypothetical protein
VDVGKNRFSWQVLIKGRAQSQNAKGNEPMPSDAELKEEIRKKRFEPEPSAANHTTGNNPNRNNSLLQKLIQLDNLLSFLFTDKTK